jgi:hypothetical protein
MPSLPRGQCVPAALAPQRRTGDVPTSASSAACPNRSLSRSLSLSPRPLPNRRSTLRNTIISTVCTTYRSEMRPRCGSATRRFSDPFDPRPASTVKSSTLARGLTWLLAASRGGGAAAASTRSGFPVSYDRRLLSGGRPTRRLSSSLSPLHLPTPSQPHTHTHTRARARAPHATTHPLLSHYDDHPAAGL